MAVLPALGRPLASGRACRRQAAGGGRQRRRRRRARRRPRGCPLRRPRRCMHAWPRAPRTDRPRTCAGRDGDPQAHRAGGGGGQGPRLGGGGAPQRHGGWGAAAVADECHWQLGCCRGVLERREAPPARAKCGDVLLLPPGDLPARRWLAGCDRKKWATRDSAPWKRTVATSGAERNGALPTGLRCPEEPAAPQQGADLGSRALVALAARSGRAYLARVWRGLGAWLDSPHRRAIRCKGGNDRE